MKVVITFKDPDGVYAGIDNVVRESLPHGISDDEWKGLLESRTQEVIEKLKPWLRWGEYVDIEFDTDAGTATVLRSAWR